MAKNLKALLAQKLAENNQRHAAAQQEAELDVGRQHLKLPVESIDPNPYQPRREFPQAELDALASSIAEVGLLQPISVRQVGERYQLVAGERRWRAHRLLGRPSIEALLIPAEDADLAVLALTENLDRQDLSDYEIGRALRRIETLFPTRKRLAEALGLNREDMYRYYAFEALPLSVQARLEVRPRLLSRAAAAELKRVLQAQTAPATTVESALATAFDRLEAGQIEQGKLAGLLTQLLANGSADVETSTPDVLRRAGRRVGSFYADERGVQLKLAAGVLAPAQQEQLRGFVLQLLGEAEH
ncbi:ParB/RepB/Spo0J family partition protein [Chitinimonas lacunae]|uniref:ParB/RepB/Spo0J family partition protein n=1 Tax=Chitinimonas lacunae TaxID=1963018 RepID=A0ABV8MWQ4_9NEIS